MTRLITILMALSVVLAAGCGSGDGTPETLERQIARAECEEFFECAGSDSEDGAIRAAYNSVQDCVDAELAMTNYTEELMRRLVEEGTVEIDTAAADECVRLLRSTCGWSQEIERACDSVYRGVVEVGESCDLDEECASGNCDGGFDTCGACSAVGTIGNPCRNLVQCHSTYDAPAYCDAGTCVAGTRGVEIGENAGPGESCGLNACGAGLYCLDGTCATWRGEGDACDVDDDACGAGTVCGRADADATDETCVPVRIESGPGEPCSDPDEIPEGEFIACDASADLFCRSGVCAVYEADVSEGGFCDRNEECEAGLRCVAYRCVGELLPNDEVCVSDVQCASFNCEFDELSFDQTCQPLPCD